MGQYFRAVNLDKEEFLDPHAFGEGLKLMEFGCSGGGLLMGLMLLLRKSTEGGGGDYGGSVTEDGGKSIVGTWATDRIAIVGDYDDSKIYEKCGEPGGYKDVSVNVLKAMVKDEYTRADLLERFPHAFCNWKSMCINGEKSEMGDHYAAMRKAGFTAKELDAAIAKGEEEREHRRNVAVGRPDLVLVVKKDGQ